MSSRVIFSSFWKVTPGARNEYQRVLATRVGLFIVFLLCGVAVFVFGSNTYSIVPTNGNALYNGGLAVVFLVAAILLQRQERLRQYAPIAYAFAVASLAWFTSTLLVGPSRAALDFLQLSEGTPQFMAVDKLRDVLLVSVTIIVLNRLSGASLGSIYLQKGNLKLGLIIGLGVLLNFGTSALMFFSQKYSDLNELSSVLMWGIVFSLANGFMEELWFRSLFLRKLTPVLGLTGSILLTSTLFSLLHVGAYYFTPVVIPIFLVNTFTLALALGYTMHKSNSLWGSMLTHAGADLFLFIATLAA